MTTLARGNMCAIIHEGELRSFTESGHEFIHQVDSPGWGHSDTEMFPVIGPTAEASYRVQVPRGNAIQDQHGMLRDMVYTLEEENPVSATFVKRYTAGNLVENGKFPDRSQARLLIWPYSFEMKKKFELTEDGLSIEFTLNSEKEMPYMFGYHPAFRIQSPKPEVKAVQRNISLADVMAVGSKALLVEGTTELELCDVRNLQINTTGFGHFMLWTEVPNMLCIEPITFYPYAVPQHELHTGFEYMGDEARCFSMLLQPAGK